MAVPDCTLKSIEDSTSECSILRIFYSNFAYHQTIRDIGTWQPVKLIQFWQGHFSQVEIIYTNIFCKHKIINSIPCLLTQLIAWQKMTRNFIQAEAKLSYICHPCNKYVATYVHMCKLSL